MMRKSGNVGRIWIRFKGEGVACDFPGYRYLSEVLRDYGYPRRCVAEWWKDSR